MIAEKKQCLYSFQAHDKYTKLFAYCATFYKFAMTEIPLFFTYLWIHIWQCEIFYWW